MQMTKRATCIEDGKELVMDHHRSLHLKHHAEGQEQYYILLVEALISNCLKIDEYKMNIQTGKHERNLLLS